MKLYCLKGNKLQDWNWIGDFNCSKRGAATQAWALGVSQKRVCQMTALAKTKNGSKGSWLTRCLQHIWAPQSSRKPKNAPSVLAYKKAPTLAATAHGFFEVCETRRWPYLVDSRACPLHLPKGKSGQLSNKLFFRLANTIHACIHLKANQNKN